MQHDAGKRNHKNLQETHECRACGVKDETQQHILKCKFLMEANKKENKIPENEKLFIGTEKIGWKYQMC